MYSRLDELLVRARSLGMVTTLTSNGTLLNAKRWGAVAPFVDVLAISIDGTPTEHDAIRRSAGAFVRTVANLEVVRASGVPFGFIFTLTQHNADSLEFVVRLAAAEGARSVQVHPLTLYGRAAETLSESRPDGLELTAALAEASRLGDELGVAVHVDALTREQLLHYRDRLVPRKPVDALTGVAPILVVDADAVVLPLTHEVNRALQLGSLATASLEALSASWLAAGYGESVADACERTWIELANAKGAPAVYWYDEVASRTFH
jgi:MoaA/NifB/PqqE/SkfB family radical SAM enzyme